MIYFDNGTTRVFYKDLLYTIEGANNKRSFRNPKDLLVYAQKKRIMYKLEKVELSKLTAAMEGEECPI